MGREKKNHNKVGWDSYLAKLRCRPLWIQIYCSQGHISPPHAWSFYPLRPVSHIISKKHLSGCIPRSISSLQEDISLGRFQTLLVICESTDWLICLFAVLFALLQPAVATESEPWRDGGKETKTVSLGADFNAISRHECHSGIKTEGGSDRGNTSNLARRCVWEHSKKKKKKTGARSNLSGESKMKRCICSASKTR